MPRRRPAAVDPVLALETAVRLLADRKPLQRGDLVRWREGCADEPLPKYGEPAVVVRQDEDGFVLMIAIGKDGCGVPIVTRRWRLQSLTARECGATLH